MWSFRWDISAIIHPGALQSYNLEMVSLVHSRVPDPSGTLIPSNIDSGSAVLSGKGGETDTISVAVSASVFNVRNATCNYLCYQCNGATGVEFDPDAYFEAVSGSAQAQVQVTWNSGNVYTNPSGTVFSIANSSIATVNSSGGITGMSPGATSVAFSLDDYPIYDVDCSGYEPCPSGNPGGGGSNTVQVPTSLKLVQVPPKILQQGNNSSTNGCPLGYYGIMLDVDYQVLDQNGAAISSSSMEPQENIPGVTTGYQDIGPSRITGTSTFTRADGTFDDAPVGVCNSVPFTTPFTDAQSIQILLNGTAYPVRTNNYQFSSTNLPNHGTITNGGDINASQ